MDFQGFTFTAHLPARDISDFKATEACTTHASGSSQ